MGALRSIGFGRDENIPDFRRGGSARVAGWISVSGRVTLPEAASARAWRPRRSVIPCAAFAPRFRDSPPRVHRAAWLQRAQRRNRESTMVDRSTHRPGWFMNCKAMLGIPSLSRTFSGTAQSATGSASVPGRCSGVVFRKIHNQCACASVVARPAGRAHLPSIGVTHCRKGLRTQPGGDAPRRYRKNAEASRSGISRTRCWRRARYQARDSRVVAVSLLRPCPAPRPNRCEQAGEYFARKNAWTPGAEAWMVFD